MFLALSVLVLTALMINPSPAHAASGDLDQTFGAGGKVIVSHPRFVAYEYSSAPRIAIQSDGKIVMVVGIPPYNRCGIMRFNQDGTVDMSFGNRGASFLQFRNYLDAYCNAIAIQSDGKIVVAGSARLEKPPLSYESYYAAARFDTDGNLDVDFDNENTLNKDGLVIIGGEKGPADGITAIAIQEDGKIVMGGWSTNPSGIGGGFAVIRLNENGTLDNTFDPADHDGIVVVTDHFVSTLRYYDWVNDKLVPIDVTLERGAPFVNDLKIQKNGKIVMVGNLTASPRIGSNLRFAVYFRLNADGSIDLNYKNNEAIGIITAPQSDYGWDNGQELELQDDGKAVMLSVHHGRVQTQMLTRVNDDGEWDVNYSNDEIHMPAGASFVSMAIQKDQNIILAGRYASAARWDSENMIVERFLSSGQPDMTFNQANGTNVVEVDFQTDFGELASDITVQPDCKIVLAGIVCERTNNFSGRSCAPALARLMSGLEGSVLCNKPLLKPEEPKALPKNWLKDIWGPKKGAVQKSKPMAPTKKTMERL